MRIVKRFAFLLAACALPAAHAEIYKWVDENGITNYTSAPPANSAGTMVDEDRGRVSTIEAYDYGPDLAATRNDALRDRVNRLEEELERSRQAEVAQDAAAAEAYRQFREQCLAQRRTDCDEPDVFLPYEPSFVVAHPPKRPIHPIPRPVRKPVKEPVAKQLGLPNSPPRVAEEEKYRARLPR